MVRKNKLKPEVAKKVNASFKEGSTGHPLKEKLYNGIVDRYSKHGNEFTFSDRFVWKGAVWVLPEIFGYIIFFTIFLYLASFSFKRYGDARTIVFFILLLIWRVQVGVKQLNQINKKLGP